MSGRPLPAGGAGSGGEWRASSAALDALPAGSRQLMLVAGGADPVGDAALVRQAAARLLIAARPATSHRSRAPRPVRRGLARRTVRRRCERDAGRMRMAGLSSAGRPMTASPQEHERVQLARHSHRARLRTIELRERAVACRERLSNHLAATATPGAFPISIRECRLTRRSLSAGSRHNRTGMRHSRRNGQQLSRKPLYQGISSGSRIWHSRHHEFR